MRVERELMGMPITVEVVDERPSTLEDIEHVYRFLHGVDDRFSTFKQTSEISKINRGEVKPYRASQAMRYIFALAEQTRRETEGYFNIERNGQRDPSGIVKGWAIEESAAVLRRAGYSHYYVEAGGDISVAGKNRDGQPWTIGIRNPFQLQQIIKVLEITDAAVATSGTYERGQHIYNPHQPEEQLQNVISITVVGPNIVDADRFATAAFAMGKNGVQFIERLRDFEAYSIDRNGCATMTSRFSQYVQL